jgi:catechol-2,3-dioxygenase
MQIKKLKLFTTNIIAQKEFYSKVLGFNISSEDHFSVSFNVGHSILEFQLRDNSTQYHFAFNIPSNKEEEALLWLKSRVKILKDGNKEIQDFDFWNAKAIYFYDADNNIVEFISRKNLNNSTHVIFDSSQVLEICEIGIPTTNIEKLYKLIHEKAGVPKFSGDMERFCAQGDENGLFIIINKTIKKWFPTNEEAIPADFEILFEQEGSIYNLTYSKEELSLKCY